MEEKENRETVTLCGASSYEQKYYFNQQFQSLRAENPAVSEGKAGAS